MATNPSSTPEGIIGLSLEGRGFDTLAKDLEKAVGLTGRMEQSVSRIGHGLEGASRTLMGFVGLAGIGAVVNDFMRLETAANRAAIAVGNVTGGRGAFSGLMGAGASAGAATGWMGQDILGGISAVQGATGGRYFTNPLNGGGRPVGYQGMFLGAYSNLTGMDPAAAGGQLGSILQMQRQNAGSMPQVMGLLASQAQMAGMGGQTGQFASTVQAVMNMGISTYASNAGPGLARNAGALVGMLQGLSPIYRDPERAVGALNAVQGGITNAWTNPRMQAWLQMNGIGYHEQRQGIVKNPDMLLQISGAAQRQYRNPVMRDLFYRSQFGLEGANVMEEIEKHPERSRSLLRKFQDSADPQQGIQRTLRTSEQTMKTMSKTLIELRQGSEKLMLGIYDQVAGIAKKLGAKGVLSQMTGGKVDDTIFTDILGLYLGGKALKWGKAAAGVARGGGAAGAGAAAVEAGGMSLGAGVLGATAVGLAIHEAAKRSMGKESHPGKGALRSTTGPRSMGGSLAAEAAELLADTLGIGPKKQKQIESQEKLTDAIERLARILRGKHPDGGRSGASFQGLGKDPQGLGTTSFASMVGAAQYSGYQTASMMVGLIGAGGGGGGGSQPASDTSPSGGTPGGTTGEPTGSGWHTATVSYYLENGKLTADGTVMRADSMWVAHKSLPFGTLIEFAYGGKKMTLPVRDRGPYIKGREFDISDAAAGFFGIKSKGVVQMKWRKAGKWHYRGYGKGYDEKPGGVRTNGQSASAASHGGGGGGHGGGGGPAPRVAGGMALGAGFGGDSLAAAGQGGVVLNVNLDGRRIERLQRLTRSM